MIVSEVTSSEKCLHSTMVPPQLHIKGMARNWLKILCESEKKAMI